MMRAPLPDQTPSASHAHSLADKAKSGKGPAQTSSWTARMRRLLLERDGTACWLCGKTMIGVKTDGTDDITIEHMHARSLCKAEGLPASYYNHPDNLVLEHAKCNLDMGHKTVAEKHAVRDMVRAGLHTTIEGWLPKIKSPPARKRIVK